ncbi:uncharacterized protein LOC126678557 [Mercurialis annua]|uniref:uncharacterized protein LOC126678557 n=1 Tax=Mercurialis annua TaxID=3986 RepID=UPI00215FF66B|nr:uncharacterized protein LOC126678557 [Mercurialis annua]
MRLFFQRIGGIVRDLLLRYWLFVILLSSELLDLPLQGRRFTWKNSLSQSRIDRCLISANAGPIWPQMSLTALPRGQSDHVPIHFRSANVFDWGPKPFRSVNTWWEHKDFSSFVAESWGLNSEVFGDQNKSIKELSQEILVKKIVAKSGLLTETEKYDISKLKTELWTAERRVDSLWVQKSRLKWNVEGDRNTKFFHSVASTHYRNNHIFSIQVGDITFVEPTNIRLHIRNFFSSLYSQSDRIVYDLSGLTFSKVTISQADILIRPFMESEIFGALCSCGINSSFMVLIPKVAGSSNIKDYRPISLVHGLFKLLSKANGLSG